MTDILTMKEIEEQFPSEWVLIGDLVTDDQLEVISGRVLSHGSDKSAVAEKFYEFRPKRFTVLYTGVLPKDRVYIL